MKKLFGVFLFAACLILSAQKKQHYGSANSAIVLDQEIEQIYNKDSFSMRRTLRELEEKGDPTTHYHWNQRLANLYYSQIDSVPRSDKVKYWFKYCTQLLLAGENIKCINEIEYLLQKQKLLYGDLIDKNNLPLIELLALAYLRLGEADNCQNNHNEFSCILPLKKEAYHVKKEGSQKAIEIYSKIYDKFPKNSYKWLLNLAYMTIGEYPSKVPEKYAIKYPNWKNEKKEFPRFKEIGMNLGIAQDGLSGGVSLEDFNNDGLIDIFVTSYGMSDQCKLFINTGNGFDDKTKDAGLEGIVSGLNCIHADYDNDGDVDIFILRGAWLGKGGNHPNSLLNNNGNGTFTDITQKAGILSFHPTQTAAWADVNNDGFLDLFIGNESKGKQSHPCELFINQHDGQFLEQSKLYNLGSIEGFIKGVAFGDINNDNWPDLYISIMGGNNMLFKNEFGTFKNIASSSGVEKPIFSFPTWFWDVNNDGYDDIFVASYDERNLKDISGDFVKELEYENIVSTKSKLFINNGDETFDDKSKVFNIDKSLYSMGSNFGDLDNDGWLDFYIGTGSPEFTSVIPNRMFRNNNGVVFEEVTSAGGFGHIQKGHGIGFADLDNDGDQDIYAVLGGAFEGDNYPNICFENPISDNQWVILKLEGIKSNKSAIGTKLKLELENGQTIFHSINTGGSFGGNSLQAEIGLGQNQLINSLTVYWSNSEAQVFKAIKGKKKYILKEGHESLIEVPYNNNKPKQNKISQF